MTFFWMTWIGSPACGMKTLAEACQKTAWQVHAYDRMRLIWKEKDLPVRRKSDPEKLAMAARLRTETILSIPRIAVRLHFGSAKSAKAKLASWMKANSHQFSPPPAETGRIDRKL